VLRFISLIARSGQGRRRSGPFREGTARAMKLPDVDRGRPVRRRVAQAKGGERINGDAD